MRDCDTVCRLGGEELVLILTDCDKQAALARADKDQRRHPPLDIKHGVHYIGRITASIGVATFPDDGNRGDDLIKAADQAMYRAKNAGRDRIVAATLFGCASACHCTNRMNDDSSITPIK